MHYKAPFNIYLAEDNIDHRELIEDMLESSNLAYRLFHAKNGSELLDLLNTKGEQADLILLDIKMPKMGGLETLQHLRDSKNFKDTPIVIITTSTINSDISKAKMLGATRFITKPLIFADIQPYVQQEGTGHANSTD